jgi:hypothetical protein
MGVDGIHVGIIVRTRPGQQFKVGRTRSRIRP